MDHVIYRDYIVNRRFFFLFTVVWPHDQRLGAKQDQLPGGFTGTSSGDCQERETSTVRACNSP